MRRLSLLLGLVPLLGLLELGLHQHFAHSAPQAADYAALAPELLKLKQPRVPMIVAPASAIFFANDFCTDVGHSLYS